MQRVSGYAVLVLLAGCSYGLVSTLVKMGLHHGYSVEQLTDGQYLFATLLLWITALFTRGPRRVSRRQWMVMAGVGLSGAGTSWAYYQALELLPASLGIVLLFQFSWMVFVIDIIVRRVRPSSAKWVGVAMITGGTVLAVGLLNAKLPAFPWWAIGLGLLAGLCYAITLYLSAYVSTETSPIFRSALTVTLSTVCILFLFPPTSLLNGSLFHGLWGWALLVSIFGQMLPMLLMLMAIPHTGGRMAGVLGSVELPVAVLVAWIVLRESVSAWQWIGVVLILAGIVISEWFTPQPTRKKKREPKEPSNH